MTKRFSLDDVDRVNITCGPWGAGASLDTRWETTNSQVRPNSPPLSQWERAAANTAQPKARHLAVLWTDTVLFVRKNDAPSSNLASLMVRTDIVPNARVELRIPDAASTDIKGCTLPADVTVASLRCSSALRAWSSDKPREKVSKRRHLCVLELLVRHSDSAISFLRALCHTQVSRASARSNQTSRPYCSGAERGWRVTSPFLASAGSSLGFTALFLRLCRSLQIGLTVAASCSSPGLRPSARA